MFRHPRANREAQLGGSVVAYEFKQGNRRTLGFSVGPEGLVVHAPKWVARSAVDVALQKKSLWIVRKLLEIRARDERQLLAQPLQWCDGMTLPYLGQPLTLQLSAPPGWRNAAPVALRHNPLTLSLPLAQGLATPPAQVRAAVQVWLMQQAKPLFIERLDHFAPQLQVQWRSLSLSNARTRWGSARLDGSIRLNWRLMHYPLPVIDYVVAHELSHLRVMDHSPRFWDTVRSVVPDYAVLRGQLRDESVPRWS
jgi:predicted metal-dependent hydrolase